MGTGAVLADKCVFLCEFCVFYVRVCVCVVSVRRSIAMRATISLLCLLAAVVSVAGYCNINVYKQYRTRMEETCKHSPVTFCNGVCRKEIVAWVTYADGCVAPNENTLPHPFLENNGIEAQYSKDMQHFKAEYKHYCKKEWNAAPGMLPSLSVVAVMVFASLYLVHFIA